MIRFKDPKVAMRRRVPVLEDIVALNDRIVAGLAAIQGFWAADKGPADAIFDPPVINEDRDGSAGLDICECLIPGLLGYISYNSRPLPQYVEDCASDDDFMGIAVSPTKVDRAQFFGDTLPQILHVFGAYRARFETDKEVLRNDWDVVCELSDYGRGRDIDGRDSVYRIWPVNYFDETLCQRAYGVGAAEVVRRAAPHCHSARIVNGGAYLIVTLDVVTGADALNALHNRIATQLGADLL